MVSLMGENPRMLILMSHQATRNEVENVIRHVRERGYRPIELPGTDRLAIGVLGSNPGQIRDAVVGLPGVLAAVPVSKPYKQVGRAWHPAPTVVDAGAVRIGEGAPLAVGGGPAAGRGAGGGRRHTAPGWPRETPRCSPCGGGPEARKSRSS